MKLESYSINEIERMYRNGIVDKSDVREYLRLWNAGPHFTQAVFVDGSIRNFDPDTKAYMQLWDEYGVRA